MRVRGRSVAITASVRDWQYALITGLSEIRRCSLSSALQYLLKLGYVKLAELLDQGCFEGEEERLLRRLVEEIRSKSDK